MSYILAGFSRDSQRSAEAALKYVIYGGVASGVMLYGTCPGHDAHPHGAAHGCARRVLVAAARVGRRVAGDGALSEGARAHACTSALAAVFNGSLGS